MGDEKLLETITTPGMPSAEPCLTPVEPRCEVRFTGAEASCIKQAQAAQRSPMDAVRPEVLKEEGRGVARIRMGDEFSRYDEAQALVFGLWDPAFKAALDRWERRAVHGELGAVKCHKRMVGSNEFVHVYAGNLLPKPDEKEVHKPQLQSGGFGLQAIEAFSRAKLRWVKLSWIERALRRGPKLGRYQDLPSDAYIEMSLEAFAERKGPWDRNQWHAFTHAWLSAEHYDPTGCKTAIIYDAVCKRVPNAKENPDEVFIFLDYTGVPQHNVEHEEFLQAQSKGTVLPPGHPALRNQEEQERFETAISAMHYLYDPAVVHVHVLDYVPQSFPMKTVEDSESLHGHSQVPDVGFRPNVTPYRCRGWCQLELTMASFSSRCPDHVDELMQDFKIWHQMRPTLFLQQLQQRAFTNQQDAVPGMVNYFNRWLDWVQACKAKHGNAFEEQASRDVQVFGRQVRMTGSCFECFNFLPGLGSK